MAIVKSRQTANTGATRIHEGRATGCSPPGVGWCCPVAVAVLHAGIIRVLVALPALIWGIWSIAHSAAVEGAVSSIAHITRINNCSAETHAKTIFVRVSDVVRARPRALLAIILLGIRDMSSSATRACSTVIQVGCMNVLTTYQRCTVALAVL